MQYYNKQQGMYQTAKGLHAQCTMYRIYMHTSAFEGWSHWDMLYLCHPYEGCIWYTIPSKRAQSAKIQTTSQQHFAAEILPSPVNHEAHTDQVGFLPALPSSKPPTVSPALSCCQGSAFFLASDNN